MSPPNAVSFLKSLVRHPARFLKAYLTIPNRTPDSSRWAKVDNLRENWDARTKKIASLIPAGAHVLEFGAGRLVLRDMLAPGCTYQPSDIFDRGSGTIVCDLNKAFPRLPRKYDYIVFSGVLEYLYDISGLVAQLGKHTDHVVASYACTDECPDMLTRRINGWVNHLTEQQFTAEFENRRFRKVARETWQGQVILCFELDPDGVRGSAP